MQISVSIEDSKALSLLYKFREKQWLLILKSKKRNAAQLFCWKLFYLNHKTSSHLWLHFTLMFSI